MKSVTVIITTKNRLKALSYTLQCLKEEFLEHQIIVCDDGSTDGTYKILSQKYPNVKFIQNSKSIGLIASRNRLLSLVKTPYVISLDDDANFLTTKVEEETIKFFENNKKCAVMSYRLFWSLSKPLNTTSYETIYRVNNYAGGAHAMRMESWYQANLKYPEWYTFYGEEDFASMRLLQKGWEIYYFPQVLVHHRVSIKKRKKQTDYLLRNRRSLHAAWSNYLIFYPKNYIARKLVYSIKEQIRLKVLKGDLYILWSILLAIWDLIRFSSKRNKFNYRLNSKDYLAYSKLEKAPLYWESK